MKTHIVYSQDKNKPRLYFNGNVAQDLDTDGYMVVEWDWSYNREDATEFVTTDAWDLLSAARKLWPKATIEVERIREPWVCINLAY